MVLIVDCFFVGVYLRSWVIKLMVFVLVLWNILLKG